MASAGAMQQSLKMLRLRWEETKSEWTDAMSLEFEEKHLVDLERQWQLTVEHLGRLSHVLSRCYQECSE